MVILTRLPRPAGSHHKGKLRDSTRLFKGAEGKCMIGAYGIKKGTPLTNPYIIQTETNPTKPKRPNSFHPT